MLFFFFFYYRCNWNFCYFRSFFFFWLKLLFLLPFFFFSCSCFSYYIPALAVFLIYSSCSEQSLLSEQADVDIWAEGLTETISTALKSSEGKWGSGKSWTRDYFFFFFAPAIYSCDINNSLSKWIQDTAAACVRVWSCHCSYISMEEDAGDAGGYLWVGCLFSPPQPKAVAATMPPVEAVLNNGWWIMMNNDFQSV